MTWITLAIVSAGAAQITPRAKSDFAVFNPGKGVWYNVSADNCAFVATKWGTAKDVIIPADYDGDGQIDAAVWRPESGTWLIRRSRDARAEIIRFGKTREESYGMADVPVPADYDGDRVADLAIWRPSTGEWLIRRSSAGYRPENTTARIVGVGGDIPVPADYDGDGKTDIALFRPSENRWLIYQSSDGQLRTETFGRAGIDVLVPADYTGDGKADVAVYSRGKWLILNSETGKAEPFVFGFEDDIAVPGGYDGDGVTDLAVYRKGTWYIYDSGEARFHSFDLGGETDIPLNSLSTRKSFSP